MNSEHEFVVKLMRDRKPGWDTQAAAIVVRFIYGDIETFIKCALPILEKKAKKQRIPTLEEI